MAVAVKSKVHRSDARRLIKDGQIEIVPVRGRANTRIHVVILTICTASYLEEEFRRGNRQNNRDGSACSREGLEHHNQWFVLLSCCANTYIDDLSRSRCGQNSSKCESRGISRKWYRRCTGQDLHTSSVPASPKDQSDDGLTSKTDVVMDVTVPVC